MSTYRLGDLIPAVSGWDLLYAAGISDDGVIVGIGGFNDEVHGFAMIPVPEPSTFGLASVAAVAAAIWRRRCRCGWRLSLSDAGGISDTNWVTGIGLFDPNGPVTLVLLILLVAARVRLRCRRIS